jgi:beta-galactosidase/beta-glucuronidase
LGSDALLWDEFSPNLYRLSLVLDSDEFEIYKQVDFGLREFKVDGTRFAINGRPVFLRGTLECAIFPKTGYPSTDVAEWKRIYSVIKSHGLNHMRFHSWCPPEAAFSAADEEGIYLQVECSSWANQSSSLGDGNPIDTFILDESEKIVKEYGNHPSFVMMTYGNEPAGKNMIMEKKGQPEDLYRRSRLAHDRF